MNSTAAPVGLHPWARIRRDTAPKTEGYYILHEGMLGILDGRLKETTYDGAKSDGEAKLMATMTGTRMVVQGREGMTG